MRAAAIEQFVVVEELGPCPDGGEAVPVQGTLQELLPRHPPDGATLRERRGVPQGGQCRGGARRSRAQRRPRHGPRPRLAQAPGQMLAQHRKRGESRTGAQRQPSGAALRAKHRRQRCGSQHRARDPMEAAAGHQQAHTRDGADGGHGRQQVAAEVDALPVAVGVGPGAGGHHPQAGGHASGGHQRQRLPHRVPQVGDLPGQHGQTDVDHRAPSRVKRVDAPGS